MMTNRVIERFAKTYTYQRPSPGATVKGRWEAGALGEPVEFRASIQPLKGFEIMLLPEGQRGIESIKIYTETLLQCLDETQKLKGDWISYNGKVFEVQPKQDWTDVERYGFYRYYAFKVETDTRSKP